MPSSTHIQTQLSKIPNDISLLLPLLRSSSLPPLSSLLPPPSSFPSSPSLQQPDETLPSLSPRPPLSSLPTSPPESSEESLPLLLSLIGLAQSGIMADGGQTVQKEAEERGERLDGLREKLEGVKAGVEHGLEERGWQAEEIAEGEEQKAAAAGIEGDEGLA